MSGLSLSSPSPILSSPLDSCSSSYPLYSIRVLDFKCHGKSSFFGSPTCTELASKHHKNFTAGSFRHRHPCRTRIHANAAGESSAGVGNMDDFSTQATVEQGRRILALQKELLEQIAERKKLVTALKKNLGQAGEQVKAYNTIDINSKDSTFLEEQPKQDFVDSKGPLPSDATSTEKPANRHGSVSPFDTSYKGQKVFESDTKSPSTTLLRDNTSPPPSAAPTVPSPAQSVPVLGEKKKAVQFTEEEKETANDKQLGEPDVTGSVSSTDEPIPPLAGPNVMNVIIVAAECAPWSKTGGLGDVAGALPKALARRGHRVMVIAPRYGNYPEAQDIGVRKRYNVAGQDLEVSYFHGFIDGVDHVFVENSNFHGFANNIYGGNREDVLKRMVLFCKAAVEVPWHVPCGGVCYGDGNLVFIANDWHTALLPVYLQAFYRDNGLMKFTRCILVIHNIAHQGRGPLSDYSFLGLPDHYIDKFRLYDPIGGEHFNIFMAGLITAHRIVAVSHGYAWECQTQLGGWGLDSVIREYNWKLRGIVNGIDDKEWSPELDVHLKTDGYTNYSLETLESGKSLCKSALQKELGLPIRSDVPLLGFIGRLDHQKGVDIIADAMPWMMEQDLQLIMLGSGRADLENMLRSFEGQHQSKVRGWVGFSVKTAHRITAGCDILLMPSRFEPCGLNQLYAMRYGTVPVVHAVGGLKDTVQAFDPYSNTGTGWTFDKAEAAGLIHALGNAMWTFRDFKESWTSLQKRCMSQDLSWDKAAKQYEEVMVAAKYQW